MKLKQATAGRVVFFIHKKSPESDANAPSFKKSLIMTAKIGFSEQLRQRQAQFNEQCKNGSAAPAPKPQQAAPAAPDDPAKFPFDVLPLRAQEFVSGAKIANGVPPEYLAACMLWTAATAAGNAAKLEVKPGNVYSPILWLALVGPPNAAKSPALDLVLRPINDSDGKAHLRYKAEKEQFDADRAAGENPQRPLPPDKVILNDSTIEALFKVHDSRPRGIAMVRDELSGYIASFDRYSRGGELNLWLSLWSGMSAAVDRSSGEPQRIDRPFVSVCGGIQPARLEGMANGELAASGFLDRFLFVWPDDLTKPDWSMTGMHKEVPEKWHAAIDKLLALNMGEGKNIGMTESAREKLFNWFNKTNKPRCIGAKNERLSGMYGKFDLHTIRLILALHLLRFAYSGDTMPGEIDAATVEDGIRIAEYFVTQSEKVHLQIFDTTAVDKLPRNVADIYDALPGEFETKTGVGIAVNRGMPERNFKRLLQRKDLFQNLDRGKWQKVL